MEKDWSNVGEALAFDGLPLEAVNASLDWAVDAGDADAVVAVGAAEPGEDSLVVDRGKEHRYIGQEELAVLDRDYQKS